MSRFWSRTSTSTSPRELIEAIRAKALGSEVATALNPSEQIVKIVRDELMAVLGFDTARFKFAPQPPTVILMAGLQGSGKTTTSGKLAAWLKKGGHRPMLVSVDVYRPAAREQLKVVAKSINAPALRRQTRFHRFVIPQRSGGIRICPRPVVRKPAGQHRHRPSLSQGSPPRSPQLRLRHPHRRHRRPPRHRRGPHDEMAQLKKELNPSEILFVADAMTGQDAVNSAAAFNARLQITGSILTKMDGDSRGGAALSASAKSPAQPIKFLGTGAKSPTPFEAFHPDRIVGRILGMGDIATLLERAEEKLDKSKAEAFAKKAPSAAKASRLKTSATSSVRSRSSAACSRSSRCCPSVGPFQGLQQAAGNVDEKQFGRVEAIIDSMTPKERRNSAIINGSRPQAHRPRLRHLRPGGQQPPSPTHPE